MPADQGLVRISQGAALECMGSERTGALQALAQHNLPSLLLLSKETFFLPKFGLSMQAVLSILKTLLLFPLSSEPGRQCDCRGDKWPLLPEPVSSLWDTIGRGGRCFRIHDTSSLSAIVASEATPLLWILFPTLQTAGLTLKGNNMRSHQVLGGVPPLLPPPDSHNILPPPLHLDSHSPTG